MDIHVVQPGDTIASIADQYGVSAESVIQNNELTNPYNLIVGQTIVITYPKQVYTVQEGDTLDDIAAANQISLMQLLRNNPFLSSREYIYPGEVLTISYDTQGSLITNGIAHAYIGKETLKKTLPSLTYLTVYNYRVSNDIEIVTYYDDAEIIQFAKEYCTLPLMMVTTLSLQGEANLELAYRILLDEAAQEQLIDGILTIVKAKGYLGVNLLFNFVNETTQQLYIDFTAKMSSRLREEGLLLFITFNLNIPETNEISFSNVDYTPICQMVDNLIFMQIIWGTNSGPPMPISDISSIHAYIDYVIKTVLPEKLILGSSVISYDWRLPYIPGVTAANSLTIDSVLELARDTDSDIQFDDVSMTPYFYYSRINSDEVEQHIVWSIDARSINALLEIVNEHKLAGLNIWNIMIYYAQLWLVIRSEFDIIKLLPE